MSMEKCSISMKILDYCSLWLLTSGPQGKGLPGHVQRAHDTQSAQRRTGMRGVATYQVLYLFVILVVWDPCIFFRSSAHYRFLVSELVKLEP